MSTYLLYTGKYKIESVSSFPLSQCSFNWAFIRTAGGCCCCD